MILGLFPTRRRAERSLVALTPSPDLFVHARELLVEADGCYATQAGTTTRPSGGFRVTLESAWGGHQRRRCGFLSLTPSPPSRISPGSRNTTPAFSNAR